MPALNATNTSAHFWRVSSKTILLREEIWLSIAGAGQRLLRNLWPHDHKAYLILACDKSGCQVLLGTSQSRCCERNRCTLEIHGYFCKSPCMYAFQEVTIYLPFG